MEDDDVQDVGQDTGADAEPAFELTPEEATGFGSGGDSPPRFNRKKVLQILGVSLAVVVGFGLILSQINSSKKKNADTETANQAARTPTDTLRSLQERAARNAVTREEIPPEIPDEGPVELPSVSFASRPEPAPPPQPAAAPSSGSGRSAADTLQAARRSPLVPEIEGSLFSRQGASYAPPAGQASANDYQAALAAQRAPPAASWPPASGDAYTVQNNQENKQAFYDSAAGGGTVRGGWFLGANAIWIGTIVPGVLETSINTDLPGNILARVTQNVYDSQTGRNLLIPQGSVLVARYNSSVSYAQSRVQIVWDTLIRPDGFQLELEGANGVDRAGMSGQAARYNEHWFEYLKAAGIVTMFSIANSRMTETAAKYAESAQAASIAESNSALVNQIGGNMVARAMNIQPTLTVENGTLINIMLNKTLYLPPVENYPVTRKYRLE